jgi:hypothetical protein
LVLATTGSAVLGKTIPGTVCPRPLGYCSVTRYGAFHRSAAFAKRFASKTASLNCGIRSANAVCKSQHMNIGFFRETLTRGNSMLSWEYIYIFLSFSSTEKRRKESLSSDGTVSNRWKNRGI